MLRFLNPFALFNGTHKAGVPVANRHKHPIWAFIVGIVELALVAAAIYGIVYAVSGKTDIKEMLEAINSPRQCARDTAGDKLVAENSDVEALIDAVCTLPRDKAIGVAWILIRKDKSAVKPIREELAACRDEEQAHRLRFILRHIPGAYEPVRKEARTFNSMRQSEKVMDEIGSQVFDGCNAQQRSPDKKATEPTLAPPQKQAASDAPVPTSVTIYNVINQAPASATSTVHSPQQIDRVGIQPVSYGSTTYGSRELPKPCNVFYPAGYTGPTYDNAWCGRRCR